MTIWQKLLTKPEIRIIEETVFDHLSHQAELNGEETLKKARHCKQCGACTPFCPAYLDTTGGTSGENGNLPFLPRRVTTSITTGSPLATNLDECTQCYTCERICKQGVSVGEIVNRFYEEYNDKQVYRSILKKYGILPPFVFFPFYTRGADSKKYVSNRLAHTRIISRRALREVRDILALEGKSARFRSPAPRQKDMRIPAAHDTVYIAQSCCNFNYPGAPRSLEVLLHRLGTECVTSENQSCCGGAPYYLGAIKYSSRLLLNARNLSVIQDTMNHEEGAPITSVCPTCYDSYRLLFNALSAPETNRMVAEFLSDIGRSIDMSQIASIEHCLDTLARQSGEIGQMIEVPLNGLKLGMHVSCHYKKWVSNDSALGLMEDLIHLTGAKAIASPVNQYCCGGAKNLFDRYRTGRRDKPSILNLEKKRDYAESGVDIIVVDCPGCQLVLDQLGIPVVHINQLLALAAGEDPKRCLGLHNHLTPPLPILRERDIL